MKALVIWLIILSYGCASPPAESVDVASASLSATCGWQQTDCSPHEPAAVCLVVTATGSVGALAEGDDPCETEPAAELVVPVGSSWASWQFGSGDFSLEAKPCQ